jgi:hypothetical protein
MDQEEFIKILTEKNYSCKMVGDTLVVDHHEHITLDDITELPDDIKFVNNGYVSLNSVAELPKHIKFENNGEVYIKTGLYKYGKHLHPKS